MALFSASGSIFPFTFLWPLIVSSDFQIPIGLFVQFIEWIPIPEPVLPFISIANVDEEFFCATGCRIFRSHSCLQHCGDVIACSEEGVLGLYSAKIFRRHQQACEREKMSR